MVTKMPAPIGNSGHGQSKRRRTTEKLRAAKTEHHSPVTAAGIPPELFDTVLHYLGTDVCGNRLDWIKDFEDLPDDVVSALQTSSLVCVHWANRCRSALFRGRTIKLQSSAEAERLLFFATRESPRLAPIVNLIQGLDLYQYYDEDRSWIQCLDHPLFRSKTKNLHLRGPVPAEFPQSLLDSPYWSVPVASPLRRSVAPFKGVYLGDIDFPSVRRLAKLIPHFRHASNLDFEDVTWDGDSDVTRLLRSIPSVSHSRLTKRSWDVTTFNCMDNTLVCLLGCMAVSPFGAVPREDRQLLFTLFKAVNPSNKDMCMESWDETYGESMLAFSVMVLRSYR